MMMTPRFTKRVLVLIIAVLALVYSDSKAQKFDYAQFPRLDFSFEHMNLVMEMDPETVSLKGTVNYRIKANIAGADTLVLNAAHMEIDQIKRGDEAVDFSLHNDSLYIPLPSAEEPGQSYQVEITYLATPRFGLFENSNGTIWTSLLPRSVRHWVPAVDHPRVTFTSDISVIVPSGLQVFASGVAQDNEIVSVDKVRHRFTISRPVPVTSLSFTIGHFETSEINYGGHKIKVAAEQGLASEEQQSTLLKEANELLRNIQDELGADLHFRELNIVLLNDHMWERKTWGSSMIYLYANWGSWHNQLKRGIYGQFFGVNQREEQWAGSLGIQLYQAALHYRLNDSPAKLNTSDEPTVQEGLSYASFSVNSWNRWQNVYASATTAPWKQVIDRTLEDMLKKEGGVYTHYDYASNWYRESGQPLFNFVPSEISIQDTASMSDSVVYRIRYIFSERDSTLKLQFNALKGMYKELVTLPLVTYLPSGSDTAEVTFTGVEDSLVVRVSPFTQNVTLLTGDRENLSFDQVKPVPFLLYVLRNAKTLDQKVDAAKKLAYHADNPDLQLAIMDYLKAGPDPEVKAALLYSLSEITRGAAGIQDIFLDALKSEHLSVRLAGLEAIKYYGRNDAVRQSVQSFATGADSIPVFIKAADILANVSTPEEFDSFVNSMIRSDTAGVRAIYSIKKQAEVGTAKKAIANATSYLNPVFGYPVRSTALRILMEYDHTPADWENRLESLLNDRDPRIRYLTVRALGRVPGLDAGSILKPGIQDEYDGRVYKAMMGIVR